MFPKLSLFLFSLFDEDLSSGLVVSLLPGSVVLLDGVLLLSRSIAKKFF